MTKAQVRKVLKNNASASIMVWHGEVYLDDGEAARMISPRILCDLNRDGLIAPTDPSDASIWLAR